MDTQFIIPFSKSARAKLFCNLLLTRYCGSARVRRTGDVHLSDEQTISHLVIDESQRVSDWSLCVSDFNGVSRIIQETTPEGVQWFAVYNIDNQIIKRINSKYVVEVGYEQ